MLWIAHRGNTNGPNPSEENEPSYVMKALSEGFHVEIDVWRIGESWYLGHDAPTYSVSVDFLLQEKVWCHAKNLRALTHLLRVGAHTFSHDTDSVVLTSRGYMWVYPGQPLNEDTIAVMPEKANYSGEILFRVKGICTDYVLRYQKGLEEQRILERDSEPGR